MHQLTAGAAISMISTGGALVAAGMHDAGFLLALGVVTGIVSICLTVNQID